MVFVALLNKINVCHSMCSDYLLYSMTASGHIIVRKYLRHYYNYENKMSVDYLKLSYETIIFLYILFILFIYTTFIKRSIHKQTCSNALFNK